MANKMLIDAAHPEETRVVVVRGNRVEEFDFESATRRQLRGNIYLAKVTRVEPSLQAAFVDYGGNRHGFLAFSEIHPDYYQIPVADRQALIEAEQREIDEATEAQGDDDATEGSAGEVPAFAQNTGTEDDGGASAAGIMAAEAASPATVSEPAEQPPFGSPAEHGEPDPREGGDAPVSTEGSDAPSGDEPPRPEDDGEVTDTHDIEVDGVEVVSDDRVESVGAEDALEEVPERRKPRVRQYKIQEVIKRRQVLLVQVVKEERGNKGAALTTYLSLAGRYSVLMPNTARGGGISRKITSVADRKRLKQVVSDLEVPEGMGVILRTAGAARTRAEVKRDFEYLLRLWENVRELTLRSTAPALVYEEGSLIKRSIRDLYNKDIDEVIVAGDDAYREAKDFMRMLMPSHAKNVQAYKEGPPLFARYGVEAQLDAMFSPQVTLKSGGYMVINPTEALVSIDVNSGRSTREHNIEDTALQTNLEAADEVARQLRLRDLAGLIVIDFIDMEEKRNNRAVERRLNDALKNDRARIQVGRISHFGLLEMSRQRIRTGVVESTTTVCPACQGTGHVRAPASVALHVLRSIEDQLLKGVTHHLTIRTRTPVALYILNQKRSHLSEIEERFGLHITVAADETISNGAHFVLERGEPVGRREIQSESIQPDSVRPEAEADVPLEPVALPEPEDEEADIGGAEEPMAEEPMAEENAGDEGGGRRRRRRRRRRPGGERGEAPAIHAEAEGEEPEGEAAEDEADTETVSASEGENDGQPRKRRRGRRGGRRGRRGRGGEAQTSAESADASDYESEVAENRIPAADAEPAVVAVNGTPHAAASEDWSPVEPAPSPALSPSEPPPLPASQAADARVDADHAVEPQHHPVAQTEQHQAAASEEARHEEPQPQTAPEQRHEEPEETAPKRSGWWQRRTSFF
jgi:ribonuclease E